MRNKYGLKYKFIFLSTLSVIVTVTLGAILQYFLFSSNPGNTVIYLIMVSVFYIVIGLSAVLFFARIMIRPVVNLTEKVRQVRDGNLDVKFVEEPPPRRIDEMDLLFEGFRHMLQTLRTNFRELIKARDEAEKSSLEAQKNHNRLEAIFNSISDGIMIIDENYSIVASNKNMRRILGHPDMDIIGHNCYQLCNGTQARCTFCNAGKVLESGKPLYTFCTKNEKQSCDEKIYEVHNFPLNDETNGKSYIIEYVKDVTEAVKMKTNVEHARRLADIGRMASKVAHEVRNPLNAIKGAAHYLRSEIENSEAKKYLMLIEEQVERVNGVTTQLLSLTKPMAPVFKPGKLDDPLDRALQVTRPQMMTKNITVNIHRDDLIPEVYINEAQLEQALINIILNAVDANPTESRLDIYLKNKENTGVVELNVRDYGCGLPEEEVDQLFTPFFTTKTKGTGLGLTIVKRIVENHRGEFILRKAGKVGTEAIISLPLNREAHAG